MLSRQLLEFLGTQRTLSLISVSPSIVLLLDWVDARILYFHSSRPIFVPQNVSLNAHAGKPVSPARSGCLDVAIVPSHSCPSRYDMAPLSGAIGIPSSCSDQYSSASFDG
ncbi:hypothetical protein KCU68_g236, partial [Aureobasidium melanogenum]